MRPHATINFAACRLTVSGGAEADVGRDGQQGFVRTAAVNHCRHWRRRQRHAAEDARQC